MSATLARATMHRMSGPEIDRFVSTGGFGVLALANGGRAFGAPLFYGAREGAIYFQTLGAERAGYFDATTEACLTISSTRGMGEWASVQLMGRLEKVDALSSKSVAHSVVMGVPPPLPWDDETAQTDEGVTTYRLVPTNRAGRYSQPAMLDAQAHDPGM